MLGPKCKLCLQNHFGLCDKVKALQVRKRIKEIEARPVKLGSKGKAKKAAAEKKAPKP